MDTTDANTDEGVSRPASRQEDLTGLDRIVWNVLTSWGAHLVVIVTGFVLPRLIDQRIGQVSLGLWDFCWSVVSYFGLAQIGIGASVNRFVAQHRSTHDLQAMRVAVSSAQAAQVTASGIVVLCTATAMWLLPRVQTLHLSAQTGVMLPVIAMLGASLAIEVACDAFRGVITGCHRWDLHNALNAASHFAGFAGMVVSLLLGGGLPSLAAVYLVSVIGREVVRVALAFHVCPGLRVGPTYIRWAQICTMVRFGGKVIIDGLARLLLVQASYVLVAGYLGPAVLALYARPLALMKHVQILINKFAFVLSPTASSLQGRGRNAELRELLVATTRYGVSGALPPLLLLGILGDPILALWMGHHYQAGMLVAIVAACAFLPVAQQPAVHILIGLNYHGRVGFASLLMALFGIALGVISLGYWKVGVVGAALALGIPTTIGNGVFVMLYACRRLDVPVAQFIRRAYLAPIACAIPCALCFGVVRTVFANRPFVALMVACASGALVSAPLYWRYIIPVDYRASVVRFLRERFASSLRDNASPLRRFLRRWGWALCRWTGVLWAWRFSHRNHVTILFGHGIVPTATNGNWRPLRQQLDANTLDATLRILSKHYCWVTLDEAVEMIQGKRPIKPYSVAVTLDDGYRNNVVYGLPLFRRYGVPVTVYVATGHAERREPFWFDRLDYALQHAALDKRAVVIAGTPVCLDSTSRSALRRTFKELRNKAKAAARSDHEMQKEVRDLATALETESGCRLGDILEADAWTAPLTPAEIRNAANAGMSFGSHTVDHLRLALITPDVIEEQLVKSKHALEEWTGRPCRHFAYPNGSYSKEASRIAQASGYISAATASEGLNELGADVFALRRISFPNNGGTAETLAAVSGLSEALSRMVPLPFVRRPHGDADRDHDS